MRHPFVRAAAAAVALVGGATSARAQTPLYSFEVLYNNAGVPDPSGTRPDNFRPNGGGTTVTQDTIGATHLLHSMKFTQVTGATFTAAIVDPVPAVINASTTTAIEFDLTIPSAGFFTGAFARMGIAEFGSDINTNILQAQTISAAEVNIELDPGTYHMTIPLIAITNPADINFPTNVPWHSIWGPNPDQLTPVSFEFYVNKSADQPLTMYMDNVRARSSPTSVWSSDTDGNWSDAGKWRGLPDSGGNTNVVPNSVDALALFGSISASGARTVTVDSPMTVGGMEFNGSGTYTIGGTSTLTMDVSSGNASISLHRGNHFISAPLVLNDNTTLTITPAVIRLTISDLKATTSGITKAGAGELVVNNVRAGALTVNSGTVTIPSNGADSGASRVGTLNVGGGALRAPPTGALDLNDNDMVVTSGTYAGVAGAIANARNGGAWDQLGITSSAARNHAADATTLGVLNGAEYIGVNGTSFDGFTVAPTNVLVKYTWYGDTDFNGSVDFDDYVRTDAGFNGGLSDWFNGDFDLNNSVDFDDYVLLDLGFNSQSGTLRRAVDFLSGDDRSMNGMNTFGLKKVVEHFDQFGNEYAGHFLSTVPEPATILCGGVVSSLTMFRRRSRRCR